MDRKNQVLNYFQKKKLLSVNNKSYARHLGDLFSWMVLADAADVTTQNLSISGKGKALVVSKQTGVSCGIEEVCYLLAKQTKITVLSKVSDGQLVKKGDMMLILQGNNRELLSFERVILNILGRMSGIATFTSHLVAITQKVKSPPKLAATRKTPWMLLDKKAVVVGGGLTHRLNQADFPLVKDTHFDILKKQSQKGLSQDIFFDVAKRMFETSSFFGVEVKTISQANVVLDAFRHFANKKDDYVFAIMLDNFNLDDASLFVKEIKKQTIYKNILIEASGEITKQNLLLWAKTGVDLLPWVS